MAICLHITRPFAALSKWRVEGVNGVQKWQGLDQMIGIRATGIYTTLSNAGMEPQSIGGSACWMIGIRSSWGLPMLYMAASGRVATTARQESPSHCSLLCFSLNVHQFFS